MILQFQKGLTLASTLEYFTRGFKPPNKSFGTLMN